MKKNISGRLLLIVVIVTGILIGIVIIENKNKTNEVTYNYKKGDVINIEDFEITILNISPLKCLRNEKCSEEVEVSIKIKNGDIYTFYTLQSFHKPEENISDSNYKIILNYNDNKISFEIK